MKNIYRGAALAGAAALVLAACGAPPEETGDGGGGGGSEAAGATADAKACMVSDQGGFDDRSFNESAFAGLQAAEESLGIETTTAESSANSEYIPNINNLIGEDCSIIVTVGFLLATATGEAAQANPEVNFAIVDATAQDADGNPIELDNVKPLDFDTAQASYLAGYLSAGMTETGTVATYGGANIPSVSIFMDGYVDGVAQYNEVHGTDVQVLGWNMDAQDGSFVGNFEDQTAGKTLTEGFISQGADIIMPVAGPVGLGTLAAAEENDGVNVVWVDTDGAVSNPDSADVILTSVMKGITPAVEEVITQAANDEFSSEHYVGTLENEGVGLAPYHEFEDDVPQELTDEVEQLRQDIIDGTVTVESPSSPTVS